MGGMMKTLEDLELAGWGQFTSDFAGFRVLRYHLPREWDHILGDERMFWRVHHDGRCYLQEQPPGGMYWLRGTAAHDTPAWQVFVLPDGKASAAFTNFRGPLAEDIEREEKAGEFECQWLPEKAVYRVQRDGFEVTTELAVLDSVAGAAMRVTVRNVDRVARRVVVMPRLIPWVTATQAAAWDMPWLFQTMAYDAATRSIRLGMGSPAGRPEQRRALRLLMDSAFPHLSFLEHEFHGHGTRERPAALANWKQWAGPDGQNVYGYPLFVAMATELNLEPGAQRAFTMLLADDRQPMADLQRVLANVDGEMTAVAAHKREALTRAEIRTPDAQFSRFVNEYMSLQQQLVLRRGWPSNMRGVRDTAQDYTSVVAWYPAESRRVIGEILETERTDGWFVRQYSTDGRKGRHDERPYVDSGLWVWELVFEHVCQNQDFSILDERLPFLDQDATTTVADHLGRLLGYYMRPENIGEHGLCKIREGDWNDSANRAGLEGRGESVMVSCHLIYCLRQAVQLHRHLGAKAAGLPDPVVAETFAASMRANVRQHALNKAGYLNGLFSDNGRWFFSDADADGKSRFNVPVNAFGILGGIFEPGEMAAVMRHLRGLRTAWGYPLFSPALGNPPVDGIGRIGSGDLPPGLGENGTCYNHGCHGFLARALAVAGEGDFCYDVLQFLLPYDQERHPVRVARNAPYAIVNVYKAAPGREGEGGDTFFSGTIATAVRNVYQSMLGATSEPAGLRFRPCLPAAWPGMSARIPYAGGELQVEVARAGAAYVVKVNGRTLTDGWYPAPT